MKNKFYIMSIPPWIYCTGVLCSVLFILIGGYCSAKSNGSIWSNILIGFGTSLLVSVLVSLSTDIIHARSEAKHAVTVLKYYIAEFEDGLTKAVNIYCDDTDVSAALSKRVKTHFGKKLADSSEFNRILFYAKELSHSLNLILSYFTVANNHYSEQYDDIVRRVRQFIGSLSIPELKEGAPVDCYSLRSLLDCVEQAEKIYDSLINAG